MARNTGRQKAIAKALTLLLPAAPYADIEAIRASATERRFADLPPSIIVWLATVAHIRHQHSDYDTLLDEGYDRDAARFFVMADINDVLTTWRATRLLEEGDDDA